MNRRARYTVLDLVRATKAAEKAGPDWAVEVAPDGTIALVRRALAPITAEPSVEPPRRVLLC